MIQIYMLVCVVLLVFDVGFLLVKNMRNHRFYPRMKAFEAQVKEEIYKKMNTGEFSQGFYSGLRRKLVKTKYLLSLQSVLDKFPDAREWFKDVIFSCMEAYKKKPDEEQAYYTYVVSVLGYENKKVPNVYASEFLDFLDSKSLYTFINTMKAVYEFGEVNLLIVAIDKVNERCGFYHKKLLVDGLLQAKVEENELSSKLIERFAGYSEHTKTCILEYFRYAQIDVADFCMEIIKDKKEDEEVRYTAIRYFLKQPNKEAVELFVNILKDVDSDWVEEMLAIQGLLDCTESEIRELIKGKINSPHWYVRNNAVEYFKKNGISKEELADVVTMNDQYALESLLYQYQDDEDMVQYITELMEKRED